MPILGKLRSLAGRSPRASYTPPVEIPLTKADLRKDLKRLALPSSDLNKVKARLPEKASMVDNVLRHIAEANAALKNDDLEQANAAISHLKNRRGKSIAVALFKKFHTRNLELGKTLIYVWQNVLAAIHKHQSDRSAMIQLKGADDECSEASNAYHDDSVPFSDVQALIQKAEDSLYNGLLGVRGVVTDLHKMGQSERNSLTAQLANGTFLPGAPNDDSWADGVIKLFELEDAQDQHHIDIHLSLKPKNYTKYRALQTKIANKIGPENWRPTIWVTIKGDEPANDSFGIIGGTGPLSDAAMLSQTMANLFKAAKLEDPDAEHAADNHDADDSEELQEGEGPSSPAYNIETVHIRLLSAPPARKNDLKYPDTGTKYAKKMARYLNRTTKFTGERHCKLALASNTAHLHMNAVRGGRFLGRLRKANTHGLKVAHVAKAIVEDVIGHTADPSQVKPLILGTIEAYDAKLYPDLFTKENVTALEVSPKEAKTLQEWINDTKAGKAKEVEPKLLKLIDEQIVAKSPTHVVLACTELPLALGGHQGVKNLKSKYRTVSFLDTEEFFAQQYTKFVLANN